MSSATDDTTALVVDASAWIAPSVQLYGKVSIAEGCSVWHNAVLRAECLDITIGRMTNLQDFVMVHVGYASPTTIGEFCSITHRATVHGATIGDDCLIGVNATIMDGAVIGAGSIVAGGAVVTEGSEFAAGSIIAGVPAKLIRTQDNAHANRLNAWLYHRNAQAYRRGDHRAWSGCDFEDWAEQKFLEVAADRDVDRD